MALTVSRSVIAEASCRRLGVDYKIQIFDADPLSPGSAKLLAEAESVNRKYDFECGDDCSNSA